MREELTVRGRSKGRHIRPAVTNLSGLTDHQWSADQWLATTALDYKARETLPP